MPGTASRTTTTIAASAVKTSTLRMDPPKSYACGSAMKSILLLAAMITANAATPDAAELKRMAARFARVDLKVDASQLESGDRQALRKLVQAARVIDDIFLDQYWSGNHKLLAELRKDNSSLGRERLSYFRLNKGPWSALDNHEAFLPDVPPHKLPGA